MNRLLLVILASLTIFVHGSSATTLYVSKLGDDSSGTSWETAYLTIQKALDAIPDGSGGHRIVIRPDTYMEAMLSPAFKGAEGSYNELVGDVDGSLGSGKSGEVVLDSGDPQKGFKSYDWWGPIRSNEQGWSKEHTDPTFSAIGWDRWTLRNLYVTGGDGGLFWDLTNETKPFTVVVEDCVGIGRAFGGGVASCLSRTEEPITFRRCHLWALDWWGDTAGAYVRVENETMPDRPDVVFEDCVMVSPQCALKGGNFGFHTYIRAKLLRCRLLALNFSQPHGTPIDGIIQSVEHGKYFHVDLEDTTVMGYKVFGVRVNKETENELGYTTTGDVQAYVQFQQEVPQGFYRLQQWPVDIFQSILPPAPKAPRDIFTQRELIKKGLCEITPIVWKERLCHLECIRPAGKGRPEEFYLVLKDAETGEELARFAEGYSLACAHVHGETLYAFASRWENDTWNDVTLFKSSDLVNWDKKVVIEQTNENLFNSSVCEGPDGFVMAYESNDPSYPAFTTKFATSPDLENWTKDPAATFGTNRYTACPCIRYVDGYYYVLYLENRAPRHYFETYITRSTDLRNWRLSAANPVLFPTEIDDGINASDPDILEFEGKTYVYYSVGDQLTWMNTKRAVYPGGLEEFLETWYDQPGVPDPGVLTPSRDKTSWFNDAKFGIFIHWGLYAVYGKNDKGPYVSWAMNQEKIPVAEYEKLADRFDPTHFDADAWMSLFKSAGARYITFTSKHHDGFCMFDSALSDYDSADRAAKRDFVRELLEAGRRAGVRVSYYYSTLDWREPRYTSDLPAYVDEYLFGQVRELCTNYGPIDGIWFDGEWDHPAETWRAPELVKMIRELQPGALINDRLGKGERGVTPLCDFYTREQPVEIREIADFEKDRPKAWEACLTIGESWGYRRDDSHFKNSAELIRALVDVASRGGNFLLNVGPTPDGEIRPEFVERLRDIGGWLSKNGESIYGTVAEPSLAPTAGKLTRKGSRLYLHLETHPGATITLAALKDDIQKVWFLETGEGIPFDNATKTLSLPPTLPNEVVSTLAIELKE